MAHAQDVDEMTFAKKEGLSERARGGNLFKKFFLDNSFLLNSTNNKWQCKT